MNLKFSNLTDNTNKDFIENSNETINIEKDQKSNSNLINKLEDKKIYINIKPNNLKNKLNLSKNN